MRIIPHPSALWALHEAEVQASVDRLAANPSDLARGQAWGAIRSASITLGYLRACLGAEESQAVARISQWLRDRAACAGLIDALVPLREIACA